MEGFSLSTYFICELPLPPWRGCGDPTVQNRSFSQQKEKVVSVELKSMSSFNYFCLCMFYLSLPVVRFDISTCDPFNLGYYSLWISTQEYSANITSYSCKLFQARIILVICFHMQTHLTPWQVDWQACAHPVSPIMQALCQFNHSFQHELLK